MGAILGVIINLVGSFAPTVAKALGASDGGIVMTAVNAIAKITGNKPLESLNEIELTKLKVSLEKEKANGYEKLLSLDSVFTSMADLSKVEIDKGKQEVLALSAQTTMVDSQSESFFRYGWRVTVAWICVVSFLLSNLLIPIALVVLAFVAPDVATKIDEVMPETIISTNLALLGYLLGYGAMRTYEKIKRSANEVLVQMEQDGDGKVRKTYEVQ